MGNEVLLGPGFGPLPPVVILGACHTAPRGAGTVSVTDLLLREGAVAVPGTQVPVSVTHNTMLMMRFFIYIAEVLAGREQHSTLLDGWHHVQTSNAVNDVLNGSRSLQAWGRHPTTSGRPVLTEFMAARFVHAPPPAGRVAMIDIRDVTAVAAITVLADGPSWMQTMEAIAANTPRRRRHRNRPHPRDIC